MRMIAEEVYNYWNGEWLKIKITDRKKERKKEWRLERRMNKKREMF